MVLCEAGMLINIASSIMMNGICCIHSLEEDERRMKKQEQVLKEHFKREWDHQFVREEQRQEQIRREKGLDAATLLAVERRRNLMASKLRASQYSSMKSKDTAACKINKGLEYAYNPTVGLQRGSSFRKVYFDDHEVPKRTILHTSRTRSATFPCTTGSVNKVTVDHNTDVNVSGYSSGISSLFDEGSDEEGDDIFEIIKLQ